MAHFENKYGAPPKTQTDEYGNPIQQGTTGHMTGGYETGGMYDTTGVGAGKGATGYGAGHGAGTFDTSLGGQQQQHRLHRSGSSGSSSVST